VWTPPPVWRSWTKCVKEYGAVGINLNPDPSGGHWTSPPLTDRHWYPIYEKMVEYDIPAMIHVSNQLQRLLSHHWRALHQRRHHGRDAAHPGRPVQGLSEHSSLSFRTAAVPHPTTGGATGVWRKS
jgi:predicted TIM-barrel fold metal-dependent hydrolase